MAQVDNEEQQELEGIVGELFDMDSGLTDWEIDFLDDISTNWNSNFTEGQADKIREIYKKLE